VIERINALAIPPAWTDVWISPHPAAHLQATGRDAAGRRQYRYHPAWRARREGEKFDRLVRFAERLPRIRARVRRDLRARGLPRRKVLAAVVRLLDMTFIRVGNDEYARLYRSFGLTTLRGRHAAIRGATVRFRFRGKSGRQHDVSIRDRRLAGIIRRCRDLPGQELFAYVDADGDPQDVNSEDVNDYLREAAGSDDLSAKDFRTWAGTVMAFCALRAVSGSEANGDAEGAIVAAVRVAADQLGNTPAVTRRSYVHPAVIEGYLNDDLREALLRSVGRTAARRATSADEAAVLALLRRARRTARRHSAQPVAGKRRLTKASTS
jgi:DNA topoisomerase-1